MNYERWPFGPAAARTPDQEARWWAECYQPDPATTLFASAPGAAALIGRPGSGKTTAMTYLVRHATGDLAIPYDTGQWPHGKRPWAPGKGHIGQIMAAAATEIVGCLERQPERFATLGPLNLSFLRWLVGFYLGRRALFRLLTRIAQATDQPMAAMEERESLYSTDSAETDTWGQIGELAELTTALGYRRIVIWSDLDEAQAMAARGDLESLLAEHSLMKHATFALRLTLPALPELLMAAERLSRSLLHLIYLDQSEAFVDEVLVRHLKAATGGRCHDLSALAEPPVLHRAQAETERLFGRPHVLAGRLQWAQTLLELSQAHCPAVDPEATALAYYTQHVPLQLADGRQGVWRGPQFIALDKTLYEALRTLFLLGGASSPEALVRMAGNSTNLNTLMSRLRAKVEPPFALSKPATGASKPKSGQPSGKPELYIHNRRDLGYWLENFVPLT